MSSSETPSTGQVPQAVRASALVTNRSVSLGESGVCRPCRWRARALGATQAGSGRHPSRRGSGWHSERDSGLLD